MKNETPWCYGRFDLRNDNCGEFCSCSDSCYNKTFNLPRCFGYFDDYSDICWNCPYCEDCDRNSWGFYLDIV